MSYFYLGAYAQAVEACKDALRLDSRFAEAYLLMGTVLLQQQSFQTAQSAFQHAIALKPNVALFHTLLGVALYKDGKIALAGKELNQALVLDPQSVPAYFYRARLQARQGERRKAIADLETAVALDSHYRKAYASRPDSTRRMGNPTRQLRPWPRSRLRCRARRAKMNACCKKFVISPISPGVSAWTCGDHARDPLVLPQDS